MTQMLALLLVTQVPEHLLIFFFPIHFLSLSVFSSVSQFSLSVVSDSLRPYELQHARLPCPSPTPGVTQTLVH